MAKRLTKLRIRYYRFRECPWLFLSYFLEVLPYRVRIEVTDLVK